MLMCVRVYVQMGDMIILPDGRLFLCNGGQEGKYTHTQDEQHNVCVFPAYCCEQHALPAFPATYTCSIASST